MVRVFIWVLLLLSPLFSQAPAGTAEMKISEILYKQTAQGSSNDEFIELYVTKAGDIEGYVISDQDSGSSHIYTFSAYQVNQGDYVVIHVVPGTDTHSGNIHHYYFGSNTPVLNNDADEVLLLIPDLTDTTVVDGVTVDAVPFDFVSYGTSGTAYDPVAPTSANGVTVTWDSADNGRLKDTPAGTSISLTPNGNDSDTSVCWEWTATTDANKKASSCPHYQPTLDTTNDATLSYSMGETNSLLPDIKLEKSSVTIYDPINSSSNPKAIPGAVKEYVIRLRNEGLGITDTGSISLRDAIPANMKLCVETIAGGQCQAPHLTEGTPASRLTLGTIRYSTDNGATFSTNFTADADGYDTAITDIELNFDGSFAASDGTNHPTLDVDMYMGVK